MATKHPLRKSCAFCRARKIKCSNETICEACRRQGADCIYDFEPLRPRTRTLSHDNITKGSADHRRRRSTSGGSIHSRSPSIISTSVSTADQPQDVRTETVASALENLFRENFGEDVKSSNNWYGSPKMHRHGPQSLQIDEAESISIQISPQGNRHTSILTLLLQDIVGLVASQHGSLGSHHVEQGRAHFFSSNLAKDSSQTMFAESLSQGDPLELYGRRQQTQLIDIWYSTHPLSFLVSKTLLLRELRDGTHDKALLAIMLADAHTSMGDNASKERGNTLLRWAVSQLATRPLQLSQSSEDDNNVPTTASTRVFHGISTAQALVLLSWSSLHSSQIRRGICYYHLACRLALEIQEQMSEVVGPLNSSRINGIDVSEVEKEIISYVYWTTHSLGLWAFTNTGNSHFFHQSTTSLRLVSIPVTEANSAIIQLDLVSDNFSTLQKQKTVIREMWPLTQVVSVISCLVALTTEGANDQRMEFRQGIYPLLLEKMASISRQVTEVPSRTLVFTIYHSLALHLLLPKAPPRHLDEAVFSSMEGIPSNMDHHDFSSMRGIPSNMNHHIFSSMEGIIEGYTAIVEQPSHSLSSFFPDVFSIALDACSRALGLIQSGLFQHAFSNQTLAPSPGNKQWGQSNDPHLEILASQLYEMSRSDWLNQGTSIRLIRKHLKARLRTLGIQFGSESSTPSSNGGLIDQPSMAHTPVCSSPLPPPSEVRRLSAPESAGFVTSGPSLAPMPMPMPMPMPNTASSMPSSFETHPGVDYFHASFNHLGKPDGQSTSVLEEDFCLARMTEFQDMWYPQMTPMMDFEMAVCVSAPDEQFEDTRRRESMEAAQLIGLGIDTGAWSLV